MSDPFDAAYDRAFDAAYDKAVGSAVADPFDAAYERATQSQGWQPPSMGPIPDGSVAAPTGLDTLDPARAALMASRPPNRPSWPERAANWLTGFRPTIPQTELDQYQQNARQAQNFAVQHPVVAQGIAGMAQAAPAGLQTDLSQAVAQNVPGPSGVAQRLAHGVGGFVGGAADPVQSEVAIATGGAGGPVLAAAKPVLARVTAVAGEGVSNLLAHVLSGATENGIAGAIMEASRVTPEEWLTNPVEAIKRIAATGAGGAAVGGVIGGVLGRTSPVGPQGLGAEAAGAKVAAEEMPRLRTDSGDARQFLREKPTRIVDTPEAVATPEVPTQTPREILADAGIPSRGTVIDQQRMQTDLPRRRESARPTAAETARERAGAPGAAELPSPVPALDEPLPAAKAVAQEPGPPKADSGDAPPPTKPPTAAPDAPEPTLRATTSTKNAAMEEDRLALGLGRINSPERMSNQQALDQARSSGLAQPKRVERLVAGIIAKPRTISNVEDAAMRIQAARLKMEARPIREKMVAAKDKAEILDLAAQLGRIQEEHDALSTALRLGGTEWGRAGQSRRVEINDDFDIVAIKSQAKAAKGSDLTPREASRFEDMASKLEASNKKVADLEARLNEERANAAIQHAKSSRPPRTKAVRDAAPRETRATLVAKTRELLKAGCLDT